MECFPDQGDLYGTSKWRQTNGLTGSLVFLTGLVIYLDR